MWTNQYSADSPLPPGAIWQALRRLHEGTVSYPGADQFELHGPFAVGTEVSVTPQGQETFRSHIVDLEENRTYADQTTYGDVTLLFRHTLQPLPNGTRVTHRLEITGPTADQVGPELGPQISGDFDESMAQLLHLAEQFHSGSPSTGTS